MLHYTVPIDRPLFTTDQVAEQLVRHILETTSLANTFGNVLAIRGEHRAANQLRDEHNNQLLSTKEELAATVSVSLNPASILWEMPTHSAAGGVWPRDRTVEHKPVLFEPTTGSSLTLHTQAAVITIELQFQSPIFDTIADVQNRIGQAFRYGEMFVAPALMLTCRIPTIINGLVYGFARLAGYPQEMFVPFLRTHSNGAIELMRNRHQQERRELSINHGIQTALCRIGTTADAPEIIREEQQISSVRIAYTLQMQLGLPSAITFEYPIVVNNQMVPDSLVCAEPGSREAAYRRAMPMFSLDEGSTLFENDDGLPVLIHNPWWDDWVPSLTSPCVGFKFLPVGSWVFLLDDPDNPTGVTTIDIAQIAELTDEAKATLIALGESVLDYGGDYNLAVYHDSIAVASSNLTLVDGVITVPNRKLTGVYRLLLSIRQETMTDDSIHVFRTLESDIIAVP